MKKGNMIDIYSVQSAVSQSELYAVTEGRDIKLLLNYSQSL
jgi:hypothetical protein